MKPTLEYFDKSGKKIRSGDLLFNDADRDKVHRVISDTAGNLFLGDYDSPLKRYSPESFWEIVDESEEMAAIRNEVGIDNKI